LGQARGDLLAGGELELFEDLLHVAYHPSANAYLKGRDTILQTAIEGVTDR
jgi:hypothetical protein